MIGNHSIKEASSTVFLSYLTHSAEFKQSLLTSWWSESGLVNEGDTLNVQSGGSPVGKFTGHLALDPFSQLAVCHLMSNTFLTLPWPFNPLLDHALFHVNPSFCPNQPRQWQGIVFLQCRGIRTMAVINSGIDYVLNVELKVANMSLNIILRDLYSHKNKLAYHQ